MSRIEAWEREKMEAELETTQAKLEDAKNQIRSLTKRVRQRVNREETIIRAVQEFYSEPPAFRVPRLPKVTGKGPEEVAVLHFSDGQIGKVTESYNTAVAAERVRHCVQVAAQVTALRRKQATIKRLVVLFGGDELEGEAIFPGQSFEIDSGAFEQAVVNAPRIYAEALVGLLGVFETVEVHEVPGNHGRAASKSVGSHHKTNWDNVLHAVTRIHLGGEATKKGLAGRLTWEENTHWNKVFSLFGNDSHLIVHGDQIRGGFAGFPWYGVGRKALAWAESVKGWRGEHRFLWHGHFHQLTRWPVGDLTILGNGSLESHNEYARAEIGLAGSPAQRLAFFNKAHGLVADQAIYLGHVTA